MEYRHQLVELTIVVVAGGIVPALLQPYYLSSNNILPNNLESLKKEHLTSDFLSQVVYSNGVRLTAEQERLIFSQVVSEKDNELFTPEIAIKYIEKVPVPLTCTAIGINPRVVYPGETGKDIDQREVVLKGLVKPGPWAEFGEPGTLAVVKFSFAKGGSRYNIEVAPVKGRDDRETVGQTGIMFSGNIHHEIKTNGDKAEKSTEQAVKTLEGWQSKCEIFYDFCEKIIVEITK
ncbi:MAG: hypothetical protein PVG03_16825 [Desulfarculaceae bacterium]